MYVQAQSLSAHHIPAISLAADFTGIDGALEAPAVIITAIAELPSRLSGPAVISRLPDASLRGVIVWTTVVTLVAAFECVMVNLLNDTW